MFKDLKYHMLMHFIVLTWGFTGILGKLIHLEFFQIVYFRVFIAGISLLLYLLFRGKKIFVKDRKITWQIIGVGVLVTLHWLTFFKAIQVSTASLGVLCLSTTTLHVSWLEPLIMKRKFLWIEAVMGLLVIMGISFVAGSLDATQYEGLFWGLTSALLAAFFSVFNLRLKREGTSSSSITVYEMFTGFILLSTILGFQGKFDSQFFMMTWTDFWWLLFLGIVCTSFAFMLMIDVVNKIGAFNASLSINLEPVYSILLAIIILHENQLLNSKFYLGAVFIVLVIFLNPLVKRWLYKNKEAGVV